MSYKVLRTIGVILTVLYVLGIAGAVIFWFMHYYAMQEGYMRFGDSLMIGCVICGVIAVIGQLGLPLIIISFGTSIGETLAYILSSTFSE